MRVCVGVYFNSVWSSTFFPTSSFAAAAATLATRLQPEKLANAKQAREKRQNTEPNQQTEWKKWKIRSFAHKCINFTKQIECSPCISRIHKSNEKKTSTNDNEIRQRHGEKRKRERRRKKRTQPSNLANNLIYEKTKRTIITNVKFFFLSTFFSILVLFLVVF